MLFQFLTKIKVILYSHILCLDMSTVTVTITPHTVLEGDNLTLECSTATNLLSKEYRWGDKNNEMIGYGRILQISNISRGDFSSSGGYHSTVYRCEITGLMPNIESTIRVRKSGSKYFYVKCKYYQLYNERSSSISLFISSQVFRCISKKPIIKRIR